MSQELTSRRKFQNFFHQFDKYGNPVTLTYNNQRTFQTVQGGICSIITGVVLTYYIITTFITHSVDVTYTTQTQQKLLESSDNVFDISNKQMQIYSLIYSSNTTIYNDLDSYVEGVYMQDHYDAATGTRNQIFYQAEKCSILFPDLTKPIYQDIYCANTDSIRIQGGAYS